jgi:hypothetical protein
MASLIVMAIGLALAVDTLCRSIIEDGRTISLASGSENDIELLRTTVPRLRTKATELQAELIAMNARTLPSLDELQQSSSKRRLRIQRVERLGNATNSESCRLVVVGTMSRLVAWLRHIDSTYLLKPDRVTLAAADEEGKRIALTIELPVSAE